MSSAPRPRRPRPTPHVAAPSTTRIGPSPRPRTDVPPPGGPTPQTGPQPIRVPSLLAALRRGAAPVAGHGSLARGVSVAAIAAGATLFVVASLSTPLVSAREADAPGPRTSAASAPVVQQALPVRPQTPTSAAAAVTVDQRPKAAVRAPSDPGAVSRLAGNGIPAVALNAYRVAAARVDHAEPGCGIDWSLLAAIGRSESDHGRFAGSKLLVDGTSTPAIVGPALTGQVWDFIPASAEYIRITGDAKYAHALGPMQFIPTTWQGYGADGNGDGKVDIFNINDAALAAARYLCAAGGDLTTQAGRVKAVLAYNHNDQYLAQVLALADAYKRGVPISGIPIGNTTGTLPKVKSTGPPPPVNPGAPTASDKDTTTKNGTTRTKTTSPTSSAPGKAGSSSAPRPAPSSTRPAGGGSTTRPSNPSSSPSKPSSKPTSAAPSPSTSAGSPATGCTFLGLPVPCG